MHILIIPSWYKTPKNPITGTFFEEQARMLQKRGHQVGILFPRHNLRFLGNSRDNNEVSVENFNDDGLPSFYSFTQSFIPKIETPTKVDINQVNYSAYKVYKKYVKEYGKPNVIHAHSVIWGGVVANHISKKENIPYFLTKHYTGWVTEPKRRASKSYRNLLQQIIANSKKTFVVSSFYKNELLKEYQLKKDKLKVIPNIVNAIFYESKGELKLNKTVNLIVIAYLIERKNHITLFKAVQLLKQKGISIVLKVVGNGSFEPQLIKYVKINGLENEIIFTGLMRRTQIVDAIKNTHIVVSASIFETFGVNIIEGLAVGRPCVVLDSGGPRDIMTEKDGILFSENSPVAFANAIENVITNYNNYNQNEISNSCVSRFGEEVVYNELMKYYLIN